MEYLDEMAVLAAAIHVVFGYMGGWFPWIIGEFFCTVWEGSYLVRGSGRFNKVSKKN